jgi:hypothetical protein
MDVYKEITDVAIATNHLNGKVRHYGQITNSTNRHARRNLIDVTCTYHYQAKVSRETLFSSNY